MLFVAQNVAPRHSHFRARLRHLRPLYCRGASRASSALGQRELDKLVMNYLIVEGYKDAAEAFGDECGVTADVDLEAVANRMKVRPPPRLPASPLPHFPSSRHSFSGAVPSRLSTECVAGGVKPAGGSDNTPPPPPSSSSSSSRPGRGCYMTPVPNCTLYC